MPINFLQKPYPKVALLYFGVVGCKPIEAIHANEKMTSANYEYIQEIANTISILVNSSDKLKKELNIFNT
jgi:hypothetical protein